MDNENITDSQEQFLKKVISETWGLGLPRIYLNDDGDLIEHWENGDIIILKSSQEIDDDWDKVGEIIDNRDGSKNDE